MGKGAWTGHGRSGMEKLPLSCLPCCLKLDLGTKGMTSLSIWERFCSLGLSSSHQSLLRHLAKYIYFTCSWPTCRPEVWFEGSRGRQWPFWNSFAPGTPQELLVIDPWPPWT